MNTACEWIKHEKNRKERKEIRPNIQIVTKNIIKQNRARKQKKKTVKQKRKSKT